MTRKAKTEAERQKACYQWLSPSQAGEMMGGISDEQVRQHIADGELAAMDVSKKNAKRADWRIAPDWIEAFNRRRTRNAEAA